MSRPNVVEQTEADVLSRYTDKFFRQVFAKTPIIPASYDGKYACMCAIALNVQATEVQMDSLETSIEAIAGVHKAFVMVGPARIPVDRVPADHDLRIKIEAGFAIDPEPEEP